MMQLFKIDNNGELINLDKLAFEENDVYLVDDKERNTIYIWVGRNIPQEKKDVTAEIARKLDKERGGSAKILIMKEKREYGSFLAMMHDLSKGRIPGVSIERRPEFTFEEPPKISKPIIAKEFQEEKEIREEPTTISRLKPPKHFVMLKPEKIEKEPPSIPESISVEKTEEKEEIGPKIQTKEWLKQLMEHRKVVSKPVIEEPVEEPDLKTYVREAAYYFSLDGYSYNDLCWILAEKIQKMNLVMPSIEDIRRKAEQVFNSSCSYDELCWLNAEMDFLIKKSLLEKKKKKLFDY